MVNVVAMLAFVLHSLSGVESANLFLNSSFHSAVVPSFAATASRHDEGCSNRFKMLPCPPGFFYRDGCCRCGKAFASDILKCNGTNLLVLSCNCVTFDNVTNLTSVGGCIYNCAVKQKNKLYLTLQREAGRLNEFCSRRGRSGVLCGKCLPNHYPLAYSFNMTCVQCHHTGWNWVRYIMAAYLPLTLFSFFILFFKIRVTNGHMITIISFSQCYSVPAICRMSLSAGSPSYIATAAKLLFSLNGIWNLDFFRPFYTDLCLGIGILPTLALDYAIAVYPLLLMIISYLLIVLYDRNYRVVTIMWRPFRLLSSLFRRNWDIRTSMIDAYATFFFLSNIKFLTVSFDLLIPTRVFQIHPISYNYTLGLFYSGDIEYFGSEHLPYAILAIVVLCVFVILPVAILALYPFAFFQKFLNLFPVRWYILHTFVDSFQGCYKDGTEPGTRDCRWFSSVYFICRIVFLMMYSVTLNVLAFALIAISVMFVVVFVVNLKPFKKNHHNIVNASFLQLFAFVCISLVCVSLSQLRMYCMAIYFALVLFFAGIFPSLYAISLFVYWAFKKRSIILYHARRIRSWRKGYAELPGEDGLSDRILNPGAYHKENMSSFVTNTKCQLKV